MAEAEKVENPIEAPEVLTEQTIVAADSQPADGIVELSERIEGEDIPEDEQVDTETIQVQVPKMVNFSGVTYDRVTGGARCPMCKMPKAHITHTLPWENDIRVRYHCCRRCGSRFKSIEEN